MASPTIVRRLLTLCVLCAFAAASGAGALWFERRQQAARAQTAQAQQLFQCAAGVVGIDIADGKAPTRATLRLGKRPSAQAAYDANAPWRLEAPLEAAGDVTTINALLEAACALPSAGRITAKPGEPPIDAAAFGLAPPRKVLRLHTADGNTQSLGIGDKSPFDDTLYVQQVAQAANAAMAVDRVDGGFAFQVDRDVLGWRDKTLLHLQASDIQEVRVSARGAGGFLLRRVAEDDFSLHQDHDARVALPADGQSARTFLASLVGLRAKQFVNESPRAAQLGHYSLDTPSYELLLTTTGRTAPYALRIGALDVGQEQHLFAQAGDRQQPVAELEGNSVLDSLRREGESLRDMRLLHLDDERVAKIRIEEGNRTLILEQNRHAPGSTQQVLAHAVPDGWRVAGEPNTPIDATRVQSVLYRLTHLRADSLSAQAASTDALQGAHLERPAITVTLSDDQNTVLGTLRVGDAAADRRAAVGDGDRIGQIFAGAIDGLSSQAGDFAPH